VIIFLKATLPEPAAGMISQYLDGQAPSGDLVGQATEAIGGFFKKD
jgi:hypothetical protein